MNIVKKQIFCGIKDNYYYDLSMCRIFAMFSIILCHFLPLYFPNSIRYVFTVGVQIFFIISGMLFSLGEINNTRNWLLKRAVKIYIPLWFWIIFKIIADLIAYRYVPNIHDAVNYGLVFFNLQGLYKIIPAFKWSYSPWFLTVIMFCYLFLILYKKIEKKFPKITGLIGSLIVFLFCVIFTILKINLMGSFLYFFLGYNFGRNKLLENRKVINPIVSASCLILSVTLFLCTRHFWDGKWIYNNVFVQISLLFLAFSIIIMISFICRCFGNKGKIIFSNPVFRWLDCISLYVYILQSFFIDERILKYSLFVSFGLLMVCLLFFSTVAYLICENIEVKILKQHRTISV